MKKNIWDDLTKNVKQWTHVAAEKAGDITRAAAEKAEELSKTGKLKLDVYQLQRDMTKLLAKLGEVAYEELSTGSRKNLSSHPDVPGLRERIQKLQDKIESKETEIEHIAHLEAQSQTVPKAEEAEPSAAEEQEASPPDEDKS